MDTSISFGTVQMDFSPSLELHNILFRCSSITAVLRKSQLRVAFTLFYVAKKNVISMPGSAEVHRTLDDTNSTAHT